MLNAVSRNRSALTSDGSNSRRIASSISNCGRIDDCTNSAQAAVGFAISRIMSFVCQVSSGPVRTRRINVVMKSASFVSAGVPSDHSGKRRLLHSPAMRPHDRLDVQPLLIAEVIIHRGDVCPGPLTDVAHRRAVETSLGKDLAGSICDSFACRIYFVSCH